jgi:hypothetical protein
MPPEQAGGRRGEVGPAADVYSLGATLYALVTGRPPFQAATPMDTVIQVVSDEPVPPRRLNASIPPDLETICLKCLEKEPGKRYASATALAEDLGRYLAGEPIVARPVTRVERAVKWARRRPTIAGLLGLVALVTALGLGGVLWQWRAAVLARGVAERESERAKAQTELAEQRLYDVRMNFVQRHWEDYNGAFLQQGLDEQLPAKQGGIERRGFEWFYWQRKVSSGHTTLKGHTGLVSSVAFSPDGRRLASAGQAVKVWDTATGQETLILKGHTGPVTSVAFSPDGRRLASAGSDQTVKVWDAGTGQETLTLKGHTGLVTSVAFSPDGRRLASGSEDRTVKVWDATPITPESRARDDVLSLIHFLLERVTSEAELRDRIAGDQTISKETRAAALKLAAGFWAQRAREQAQSLVSSRFERLPRADVLDSVRNDPTLGPEVRAAALALAETWPESALALNEAAWPLVKLPSRPEADFRRGLRLAEQACQLEPENSWRYCAYLNTLGVAQYRAGQYEKARATLTQSNRLNGNRSPADLAFLAMTQHRLNQVAAARATLERLREVMKGPNFAGNLENQGFLGEAESVMRNSPDLPEDVFAP